MNKKTTLAGVLAATLILTSACGNDDKAGGTSSSGGGKVELTYWSWAPNMDKVVAGWNATHPDVHVTVNKQDGGDPAVTKLLTAIKAGSGAPDVMQAEYQKMPTLVSANAIADIGKLAGSLKEKFPGSAWNAVTLGSDAVYGVPQDTGPMMFFYRSDVFDKLGLKAPATWDDYAADAKKIHQANAKHYLGTFSANDPGWFTGLSQQAGASWWGVQGDSWSVNINDANSQKVATYWGNLVQQGVIDNKPMYTPEWNAALNDGTQVGWLGAVWSPGVLEGNAAKTKGKWKAAMLPQWDTSKATNGNWGGSATSVTSQSKHKDQAAQFITWLNTDPAALKALASDSNVYPAANDATGTALTSPPAFFSNQPDFYTIAQQSAQATNPFTYGPDVNVTFSSYNDAFGKAAESKQAAQFTAALATMQQATTTDMKNTGFKLAG
ncbi:ABC transporter substrate-binding protein [Actinoplanes sp. NPDC051343]|uniref:ABC transporter substrate-binding protein n=1 Tax=Actinoplanes sp. NPDC051343 TaxID=3363906 RepID=UPI003794A8FF